MTERKSKWPETDRIHDRGIGPEIRGTRIVMTDIYPHLKTWTLEQIAEFYRLNPADVRAAADYIAEHQELVEADMAVLRERAARGNPPHVMALLQKNRAKLQAMKSAHEAKLRGRGSDARVAG